MYLLRKEPNLVLSYNKIDRFPRIKMVVYYIYIVYFIKVTIEQFSQKLKSIYYSVNYKVFVYFPCRISKEYIRYK